MKKLLIEQIINNENVENILIEELNKLYVYGPSDYTTLEIFTYIKIYQPEIFNKYENSILKMMGLFFKNPGTTSFRDIIFNLYSEKIQKDYKGNYTPIQAKMIESINTQKYFSFSSPTSTGKSFVFRHVISSFKNDIVIIVPSRALINEYYILLNQIFESPEINILTFVDLINKKKAKRNIFIVTPERTKDLFVLKEKINLDLLLFDEAQLSDDYSVRGIYYDSVIRRCITNFPNAKMVFAYPFVDNPEVQYVKNKIQYDEKEYKKFTERNVGQIFYSYTDSNFYHFGLNKDVLGNKIEINYDPAEKVILNHGSILVYCSKLSIYNKKIFFQFSKYIKLCREIVEEEALGLIEKFRLLIGASAFSNGDYSSRMVSLLKRGIVVHHGSLPLAARYILEEFTKRGFCRICFATSTLEQGINMPFDLVWVERFEPSKPLNIKNIIGRAGRSTEKPVFDYGQIVIKDSSRAQLRNILKNGSRLNEVSQLDQVTDSNDDYKEYKEAIKKGEFSEEYNLTNKELNRLRTIATMDAVKNVLDELFINGQIDIKSKIDLSYSSMFYKEFEIIYSNYLNRQLTTPESEILNNVVKIMLWRVVGKSFSQIVWYRYSYAARTNERNEYKKEIEKADNNEKYYLTQEMKSLEAKYLAKFQQIPNKKLVALNINYQTLAYNVDYDQIVVDTYDYLDKLIGFRLGDAFYAAFDLYFNKEHDERAKKMCNYIKYGTNNAKEIMMLRYGFDFEDFEWLNQIIKNINEDEIIFGNTSKLYIEQQNKIKKYL